MPIDFDTPEELKAALAVKELAEEESEDEESLLDDLEEYHYPDSYKAENWIIFLDEEEAHTAAVNYVKEMLELEPEVFNQDWLMSIIDVEKAADLFTQIYGEWNYSYAEGIKDDAASAGSEFDTRLEEEMADAGVDNIDDFVDYLTQSQIDEGTGGYDHFESNFGVEEAGKLVMEHNLIDIDEAAESAVDTDGWAHFLSTYDGEYRELPSGAVYFRE